jgi:hypothetical protein
MAINYTLTAATGVLTATASPANTETVIVGGKTYTFQTTLTDVDGNVNIGADAAGSLTNLIAAINLSNEGESAVGAGTDYAAAMTKNAEVEAFLTTATTMTVRAYTPGSVGNLIASTETVTTGVAWGAAVLENGAGHVDGYLESLIRFSRS